MTTENPNQIGTSISNQSKNVAQGENPTHSFLYLHPSETPTTPIVSSVLD